MNTITTRTIILLLTLVSTQYKYCYRLQVNTELSESAQTRLEIVVDNRRLDLVEVFESGDSLNDDRPRFFLRQKLVLLQIEVEVVTLTVTKHCTKPVRHTHTSISSPSLPQVEDKVTIKLQVNDTVFAYNH